MFGHGILGTAVDSAFAIFLFVRSLIVFWRLRARPAGGDPAQSRLAFYRRVRVQGPLLVVPPLLLCAIGRVDLRALGLTGDRSELGIALVIALLLFAVERLGSWGIARTGISERQQRALGTERILPRTPEELRRWTWVAINAGVWEEIVYRGYLLWLFSRWMPQSWAILPSALLFGLAHLIQGPRRTVFITGLGALFAALYLLIGSLWPVIVLHAGFDLVVARLSYRRRQALPATPLPT